MNQLVDRPKLLFFAVAGFLISQAGALAENREGAFTLSPYLGGQMSLFVGESHLDGDYKWGIRGGYNFTPHIGAEFAFGENQTVHDPESVRCTIRQYGGDFLYFFMPEKRFVPYIATGFGAFNVDYKEISPDRRTAYFDFGGGAEYALTSWVSLRGDIRHTVTLDDGNNLFEATIGLSFQLGHFHSH